MNADQIARALIQAAQGPPPDLSTVYEPDEIAGVLEELETLEGELDARHPGWRQFKPFDKRPDKVRAGIKLCLKRRDLLLHGRRDWGCWIDAAGNAVPLPPPKRGVAVVAHLEAYQLPVSPAVLSGALGISPETAVAAVAAARALGVAPTRRWVRAWVAAQDEVAEAEVRKPRRVGGAH